MKYTIDEENKIIVIHSFGSIPIIAETVIDFLEGFEEFEIRLKTLSDISHTMVTDSGYKYNYVPDSNPYEITAVNEVAGSAQPRECDCGRNGAICSCTAGPIKK